MDYVNRYHRAEDKETFRCDSANWPALDYLDGNLWPFGIEKTFVKHTWKQNDKLEDRLTDIAKEISERYEAKEFNSVYSDPGCVEFTSHPIKNMAKAKKFFELASKIAVDEYKLSHTSETVCGTGGHIHVEKPVCPMASKAIVNLAAMYPGMGLFANEQDDINAKSYGLMLLHRINECHIFAKDNSYHSWVFTNDLSQTLDNFDLLAKYTDSMTGIDMDPGYGLSDVIAILRGQDGYNMTLTPRPKTHEFRCFDVTEDWDEQKLHIDFVQAFVRYATKNRETLGVYNICASEIVDGVFLSPKQLIANFKELLEVIGLDSFKYEKYYKNAKMRSRLEIKRANWSIKEFYRVANGHPVMVDDINFTLEELCNP